MTQADVRIERVPSIAVAVVRRRAASAELSKLVPEGCGLVWDALRKQNTKAGRNVAIYWNDEIRLEAGVEVQGPFEERDSVVRSATPAGLAAVVTHVGPYHTLGVAHDAIHRWCRENGHQLAGPRWEIYGHWQPEWNTNPAAIRTDVVYQLA